jgi:glycosyltransferase involved in cell wall biosynthesis
MFNGLRRVADVDVLIMEPARSLSVTRADHGSVRVVLAETPERQDLARFESNPELTRRVEQVLGVKISDYDLVVGRFMWGASQLAKPREVATILDLDDFRYRYDENADWTPRVVLERVRKALSYRLASRQLGRFHAAFFSSPLDKANAAIDSMLLPNIPFAAPARPDFDSRGERLLFVGSLWYRPNREGVDWFLRHVWPRVMKARPTATVKLVGAAAPDLRERWSRHPNVQAPGFADNLVAEYADAALVIVPIHSGGGSNIKVLESLAYGRACVVTRFCLEPYRDVLHDGVQVAAAGDAQAFASHCVELLANPSRRSTLARRGYEAVSSRYTEDRFHAIVEAMVRRVLQ